MSDLMKHDDASSYCQNKNTRNVKFERLLESNFATRILDIDNVISATAILNLTALHYKMCALSWRYAVLEVCICTDDICMLNCCNFNFCFLTRIL